MALVSSDAGKAKSLGSKFGAGQFYSYDSFGECLRNPGVRAVYIATTNSTHLQFALRAAAQGKHVLCEKPLATTVTDCQEMVDACRKNGVRLMTAYRKYFEPASLALKKLVTSGKLGKLRSIHTAFTINLPANAAWHLDAAMAGGGSLVDLGIYCINTVRWLTGQEPLEVSAITWATDAGRFANVEENIAFQLKFPAGLYVQGSCSFTAAKASFLQIHGEQGWAALDPAYAYNQERRLFGEVEGRWFEKRFEIIDEFSLELDHLSGCIQTNRDPEPDGITGLRDVAVIQAIYQAAKTGRAAPIEFPPLVTPAD